MRSKSLLSLVGLAMAAGLSFAACATGIDDSTGSAPLGNAGEGGTEDVSTTSASSSSSGSGSSNGSSSGSSTSSSSSGTGSSSGVTGEDAGGTSSGDDAAAPGDDGGTTSSSSSSGSSSGTTAANCPQTSKYLSEWDAVELLVGLGVNVPTCSTSATCTSSQCCYVFVSTGYCVTQ